jgi:hypothetical protein
LCDYKIDGSKELLGVRQKDNTRLKFLMSNCMNFEEDEYILRAVGRKMYAP